jgi:hypothetical protein
VANISQRIRWIVGIPAFIAAVGAAYKVIAETFNSGFWSRLNGWHVLLALSCITLLALGVNWYIEYLSSQFANIGQQLQDALRKEAQARGAGHSTAMQADELLEKRLLDHIKPLEESIRTLSPPTQTDYELTLTLRNEVQRFMDDLSQQPVPDFNLPQDAFNRQLYEMGAFERKLTHGFQLRFRSRLEYLVHRLGEKNIEDLDLNSCLEHPPKNLPMLNKIRDALSTIAVDLKP